MATGSPITRMNPESPSCISALCRDLEKAFGFRRTAATMHKQYDGAPKRLFKPDSTQVLINNLYDVTPDGQRFLILSAAPRRDSALMTVVLNWPSALVSTGK